MRNTVFLVAMLSIVVAAVLAIIVVRSITRAQHDAWDAMTMRGAADPYGGTTAPVPWSSPAPTPPAATPPVAPPPPADPSPPSWPGPAPSGP